MYQENDADTSEFFYDLPQGYPVTFATNFKGLGLPAPVYSNFLTLFSYFNGVNSVNVTCDNTLDGICVLPAPCANFTAYNDFAFKFNFTNTNDGNYMRIPMAAFAEEVLVGSGNSLCNLYVTYLDSNAEQSQDVILGGMFFQEFFGMFTNDYTQVNDPTQEVSLWVGRDAKLNAYIGNEVLPTGVNPFVPVVPTEEPTPSAIWVVLLVVVLIALAAFLAWSYYRMKLAKLA